MERRSFLAGIFGAKAAVCQSQLPQFVHKPYAVGWKFSGKILHSWVVVLGQDEDGIWQTTDDGTLTRISHTRTPQ